MGELGIIIPVLSGAIIVFLVCRRLVCRYRKSNRPVELTERQNSLLRSSLSSKINSSGENSAGTNNLQIQSETIKDDDYFYFDELTQNFDKRKWLCSKCYGVTKISEFKCKNCGKNRGKLIT